MMSKFKVGDRVKIKDEDLVGKIIKIDRTFMAEIDIDAYIDVYILDIISLYVYYIDDELELVKEGELNEI